MLQASGCICGKRPLVLCNCSLYLRIQSRTSVSPQKFPICIYRLISAFFLCWDTVYSQLLSICICIYKTAVMHMVILSFCSSEHKCWVLSSYIYITKDVNAGRQRHKVSSSLWFSGRHSNSVNMTLVWSHIKLAFFTENWCCHFYLSGLATIEFTLHFLFNTG